MEGTLLNLFLALGFVAFMYILYARYVLPVDLYKYGKAQAMAHGSAPLTSSLDYTKKRTSKTTNRVKPLIANYLETIYSLYLSRGMPVKKIDSFDGIDMIVGNVLVKTIEAPVEDFKEKDFSFFIERCNIFMSNKSRETEDYSILIILAENFVNTSLHSKILKFQSQGINISYKIIPIQKAALEISINNSKRKS